MMEYIIRAGFRWTVALLLCLATQNGIADGVAMMGMCSKCHGEDGVSMDPKYPTIAGIPAEIQEDALYAYRDGGRNCESVPMMCKMVKKLTDDQIVEMSAHFSAMPFRPAEQDFDADLATKGEALHNENCQACHGDGPEEADSSILHGQWADYLRYALAQYAAGVREQPPNMKKRTDELTEADIDALVNFYASYR
jgi:sulfide dehydrogenase cytochrome subunit